MATNLSKQWRIKARRFLLGMNFVDGFLYKIIIYTLLISFSYIYLYPMLYMLVTSFMSVEDLIDPGIKWIPSILVYANYIKALSVLEFPASVFSTTGYVLKVSLSVTASSALIGYGFARFNFPLKKLVLRAHARHVHPSFASDDGRQYVDF
jgi:multiple sugar transport system permease protein